MELISKLPKKDNKYQCPICGRYYDAGDFDIDHKVPLSKVGTNAEDNLQALCRKCNRIKSDKSETNYFT